MTMLFREEVIARRAAAVFGEVLALSSRTTAVLAMTALAFACGVVGLLFTGTYAPKARVVGFLVPSHGLIRVVSPRDGFVTALHVREGEPVREHQALLTLTSPVDSATGEDTGAAQVDVLMRELGVLTTQVRREQDLAAASIANLAHRTGAVSQQQAIVTERMRTTLQRVDLLQQDIRRLHALAAEGHLAATLLDSRLIDLLTAQEHHQSLALELAHLASESIALEAERFQIPLRLESRLAELEVRRLASERSLVAVTAQWTVVVRAPIAGTVAGLTAHPSSHLVGGRLVMNIIPDASTLQAELAVPTHAAGFLELGQEVRLRYDAYPYQRSGLHPATIVAISQTVTGYDEHPLPVYRVLAEPARQSLAVGGRQVQLRDGMTLRADLLRERRRLIRWIFDPLYETARSL